MTEERASRGDIPIHHEIIRPSQLCDPDVLCAPSQSLRVSSLGTQPASQPKEVCKSPGNDARSDQKHIAQASRPWRRREDQVKRFKRYRYPTHYPQCMLHRRATHPRPHLSHLILQDPAHLASPTKNRFLYDNVHVEKISRQPAIHPRAGASSPKSKVG